MTTRAEAAGYAEAWATRADRHATDYRNLSYEALVTDPSRAGYHAALRVQADAMALLWVRIAELQPEETPGTFANLHKAAARYNREVEAANLATVMRAEEPSAEPLCRCGHRMDQHGDEHDDSWAPQSCRACPGDEERSWKHPFTPEGPVALTGQGERRCQSQYRPDGGALVQCGRALHLGDGVHTDFDPDEPLDASAGPANITRRVWRDEDEAAHGA